MGNFKKFTRVSKWAYGNCKNAAFAVVFVGDVHRVRISLEIAWLITRYCHLGRIIRMLSKAE